MISNLWLQYLLWHIIQVEHSTKSLNSCCCCSVGRRMKMFGAREMNKKKNDEAVEV